MSEKTDKNGANRQPDGTFGPGNNANPNGRPKFSLVSILKEELQKCPKGEDKKTYAYMLVRRIIKSAIQDGNDQQIKNILNYVDGMPTQRIEGDFNERKVDSEEIIAIMQSIKNSEEAEKNVKTNGSGK